MSGKWFRPWRLILDSEGEADWNMAIDEAILDMVAEGASPPTLRLYRWAGAAVSVGRFQDVARGVNVEACGALGIPIVRRPTGGRGILHGWDQTFSVIVPVDDLGGSGVRIIDSYRLLLEPVGSALGSLGIPTSLGVCERVSGRGGDCFAARTRADLLAASDGQKLVGSAQRRRNGTILQQCSLIHRVPGVRPEEVFHGRTGRNSYPLRDVNEDEMATAIVRGFREVLGLRFSNQSLTGEEVRRAESIGSALAAGGDLGCDRDL